MKTVKLGHDRVNLVWSTDWHLSAVPPGRRGDDYEAAILGKLGFVRRIADKVCGVALCGGDAFHIKNPRHPANSLGMLIRVLHVLRTFPTGMVYGTVGNHDLGYGERMDSLPSQPLGVLIAAGAYFNLSDEPVMLQSSSGSIRVVVESFPYDHAEGTLARILASKRHPDATHRVGIVHAYGEAGGGGMSWAEKTIGYDQVAEAGFDFMLWGHDHSRKETIEVGNTMHVHLGSLARAALDTDQADRIVACAVLSFSKQPLPDSGIRYREIHVPVKPLEEAFAAADKGVRTVGKSQEVKDFFARMDEAVEGVETSDPAEALRMLCPDDPKLLGLAKDLCGL